MSNSIDGVSTLSQPPALVIEADVPYDAAASDPLSVGFLSASGGDLLSPPNAPSSPLSAARSPRLSASPSGMVKLLADTTPVERATDAFDSPTLPSAAGGLPMFSVREVLEMFENTTPPRVNPVGGRSIIALPIVRTTTTGSKRLSFAGGPPTTQPSILNVANVGAASENKAPTVPTATTTPTKVVAAAAPLQVAAAPSHAKRKSRSAPAAAAAAAASAPVAGNVGAAGGGGETAAETSSSLTPSSSKAKKFKTVHALFRKNEVVAQCRFAVTKDELKNWKSAIAAGENSTGGIYLYVNPDKETEMIIEGAVFKKVTKKKKK